MEGLAPGMTRENQKRLEAYTAEIAEILSPNSNQEAIRTGRVHFFLCH